MKKILSIFLLVIIPVIAWAAGSVTQTFTDVNSEVMCLKFAWTGDATTGSVPATASTTDIDGWILMATTNPGATAPTDNYDITLLDSDGVDVAGGQLLNRDTASSEVAIFDIDSTSLPFGRFVDGKITFTLENNSATGAVGECKIYYKR